MCCQVQPPHGPMPGTASMPKWRQRGVIRCGDARSTSSSLARRPVSSMRTRSPGIVKGTGTRAPRTSARPSPFAASASISTETTN
ncbi:MAG: hypothetical protein DMF87_24895 [Acidobacteria bacterium]|nr:MAG: hypothetical protein DMF87_24895 [Acidobacteriota bacterium]